MNISATSLHDCHTLLPGAQSWKLSQLGDTCYQYFDTWRDNTNWETAQSRCQTDGGRLVEIHNSQELEHVEQLRNRIGFSAIVWIGASDARVEGHWLWTNGNVLLYI
jgi:hypothetical protein